MNRDLIRELPPSKIYVVTRGGADTQPEEDTPEVSAPSQVWNRSSQRRRGQGMPARAPENETPSETLEKVVIPEPDLRIDPGMETPSQDEFRRARCNNPLF